MAASINDVVLSYAWLDVNTSTGISVGTEVLLQNKSPKPVFIWLGTSAPTSTSAGYRLLPGESLIVDYGEPKIWAFGKGNILVQV